MDSVKKRRERLNFSQQRLAQEAKISLSMVRLLDYGYEPAEGTALNRVHKVLDEAEKAAA